MVARGVPLGFGAECQFYQRICAISGNKSSARWSEAEDVAPPSRRYQHTFQVLEYSSMPSGRVSEPSVAVIFEY